MTDMQIKEIKPSDRVQVLDHPAGPPGKCLVCGAGADPERKWIDFGVTIDLLGAVYICNFCIAEVANALNFATAEQTSKMLQDIATLTTALGEVSDERNHLRSAIEHLNAAGIPVSISLDESESSKATESIEHDASGDSAPKFNLD